MAVQIVKYYSSSYQASCLPARCSTTLKWSRIATDHLKSKCSKVSSRRQKISCNGLYGDKDELLKQKKALEALLRLSEEAGTGSAPNLLSCFQTDRGHDSQVSGVQ